MATPAMSFDAAPVQQDTAVGMTFDTAPTSTPLAVNAASTSQQNQPQQPQAAAPSYAAPSISAVPEPTGLAAKLQRWATNVSHDLQYGTDLTGVGSVLKSMGAHGLYNGNPQTVGDFMGSLPLGLLRAGKGTAETLQQGERGQGLLDIAGGALDASTMPAAVAGPEVGEVGAQGIDAAAQQAARAAKAVRKNVSSTLDASSIQAPMQSAIRSTLANVAKEAGVTVSPSESLRDAAGQVADAVLAKSRALYSQLDAATGGRFQRYDDALSNLNHKLRETVGLDDEQEAALTQRKAEIEKAREEAFERAKAQGVDPALIDRANASYKQGQALHDLDHTVKQAVSGQRPELAGPNSTPETIDPKAAFQRLNRLYDTGRLQQAVGSHAADLLQTVDAAHLQSLKIGNRLRAIRTAAKVAGVGAAAGAVGEAGKAIKDSF